MIESSLHLRNSKCRLLFRFSGSLKRASKQCASHRFLPLWVQPQELVDDAFGIGRVGGGKQRLHVIVCRLKPIRININTLQDKWNKTE